MNNRTKFIKLRKQYGTFKDLSAAMDIPVSTLKSWVHPKTSKAARSCPDWVIDELTELLRVK